MKINSNQLDKMHLSIVHPVKTVGYSVKVTPETKERMQKLIKADYTAEDIIRVACEVHEIKIAEMRQALKSGDIKRKMHLMREAK